MYQTNYHRPTSLAEAAQLFSGADDAAYLSGGHTLIPTMKQRLAAPSDLIDLTHIAELKGIDHSGDTLTIGAATTHAEVAASDAVRGAIPALAELAGSIARQKVILRQGIDSALARELVKKIKGSKIRVQAAVQGEKLRVSGKKRDDLQAVIALLREADAELPLQYENFRD